MAKTSNQLDRIWNPLTNDSLSGFGSSVHNIVENNNIYFLYFENLCLNLFKWKGLPKTMDGNFLEYCLFWDGMACAVKDPVLGDVNLHAAPIGKLNIYNLPTKIQGYSNDFQRIYEDFCLCRNNQQMIPTSIYVKHFTDVIANIEQTIQTNLQAQKTPVVFTGSPEQIQALKNTYLKYVGNNPYIFASQEFQDAIKIEALKTDAPFIADKLYGMKKDYIDEFMTFIGVNSVTDKKERMITDEANANNQFISLNLTTMQEWRERFAEEMREFFNKPDIEVVPNVQSVILENDKFFEGGQENGDVYDEPGSSGK